MRLLCQISKEEEEVKSEELAPRFCNAKITEQILCIVGVSQKLVRVRIEKEKGKRKEKKNW